MKTLLFLFFAVFSAPGLFAQPESGGMSFSIPPANNMNTAPSGAAIKAPSIFDEVRNSGSINEAKPLNSNFGKPSDFANPNERYIEKMNKSEGEVATAIRKNQYLGDFKTKAAIVRINYRDHEAYDGDVIKVIVNDHVIREGIIMESTIEGFDLGLVPGFNKIEFEALNQGTSGPNTAEFQIIDDKGELISSNRWNLATGFRATVILVRE
ncbi:MAG TPA: hypothetical protein VGB50_11530 [Flavobacterium sp.]|jgi:hypothetical protein